MMMKTIKDYFDIQELVCPDVYARFGSMAWTFFDEGLLSTLLRIRQAINKPMYINNWQIGGNLKERGLRCNLCNIVDAKTASRIPYISPHIQGKAVDFNVSGMTPDQVQKWLMNNKHLLTHPIRLELNTPTWTHIDVRNDNSFDKIVTFKA